MKRIYFDIDNPEFITWLKTRPADAYLVLLDSDTPENASDIVFAKVANEGIDLAQWVVEKIKSGEMEVKVSAKAELPQGIVLE